MHLASLANFLKMLSHFVKMREDLFMGEVGSLVVGTR
jgi:hypothetical protein